MIFRKTTKHRVSHSLQLERRALQRHQTLTLNHEKCVGCRICVYSCPEKAINERFPPIIKNGALVKKAIFDIDTEKCNFCGICVITCPTNTLEIKTNGKIHGPGGAAGIP